MKNVFIALGKAICYTLLFVLMQLIASFVVTLAMGIGYAVEQLTLNGGLDYNTLMTVLYDGVTTNATLITLVSNICTVGVLFAFFALRKKNLLSGEMPSLVGDGKGCAFASRCKFCKEICKEQRPEMKTVGDDHFAACHFAGELTF